MTDLPTLNALFLEVSRSPDLDSGDYLTAAKLICKAACSGLKCSRTSIWHLNPEQTELNCLALYQDGVFESAEFTLTAKEYPKYFDAVKDTRFIVANDANNHPDTSEFSEHYLKPQGISSMLDAPIRQGGEMVGIICSEHIGDVREWSELEKSFSGALSDMLGRALTAKDRKEACLKLEKANEQLENMVAERTKELVLAQTQISDQEKMASLGQLVAGVAHEINTPIGIGVTTASHIEHMTYEVKQAFESGTITESQFSNFISSVEEGTKLLLDNLNRAAKLIKSFKQVAVDQSDNSFLLVNLKTTLSNIADSLRPELKKKYRTQIQLDCPDGIALYTCPGSIAQILTNLIVNAGIHAFPEEQTDRQVHITAKEEGRQIEIIIEDNGQGVADEIKDKAFEPFVTTRRAQGGSGLGLNIVHNLVTQKLNGIIELTSEKGKFTRFRLTIPAQQPEA